MRAMQHCARIQSTMVEVDADVTDTCSLALESTRASSPAAGLDVVVSLEPPAECAPVACVGEYVRVICFHEGHHKSEGGWLPSSLV